ncbi:MAG: Re/Si-specific NAD(P)(+) transhydrogenase subunit alpha [Candidatus Methylomirabilia bacterium]
MKIGVPREVHPGEKRVATSPGVAAQLIKLGFAVAVESGAGDAADFSDEAYREAGAEIVPDARSLWDAAEIVLKVRAPERHPQLGVDETDLLRAGACLICFLWPAQNPELLQRLAAKQATVLAMDSVPRVSRAQKLDALSSMANIAGYRAVIEAAYHFGRFFTGQITAAGKVPPARVFVIGAGVAGLSAVGTAAGLGAVVRANDSRPEVGDQIRSLGAEFLEVNYQEEGAGAGGYAKVMSQGYQSAQWELFARQAMEVDVIITTALIPGKPAPKLITAGMVETMKRGSVIVDLAAEQGGNCELTVPGAVVVHHGVTIIGYTDLPSRLARQSSTMYATNLLHLLEELCPSRDGALVVNMEDEVIRGTTVVKEGAITWPPPPVKIAALPEPRLATVAPPHAAAANKPGKGKTGTSPALRFATTLGVAGLALLGLGLVAPPAFLAHLTVFVLACFLGYLVIWNVTPALHTPLMSVTNAISGIIVIGAVLQVASPRGVIALLAGVAVLIATINIAGGFLVTRRMLAMFRKER